MIFDPRSATVRHVLNLEFSPPNVSQGLCLSKRVSL